MPTPIPTTAVFPFEPDGGFPLREKWTYFTDVHTASNGRERRVPLVIIPRLNVTFTVTALDAGEAARLLATLWVELDNRWYVPRWTSARAFTKAGTVYTLDRTATNFFTGGKAIVWRSSSVYDVMTVDAQGVGTITLSGATTFDHTLVGVVVAPLMNGSYTPQFEIDRGATLVARNEFTFAIDVAEYRNVPLHGSIIQLYRGVELLTEVFSGDDPSEPWATRTELSGGVASSKFILRPLDERATGVLKMKYIATSLLEYRDLKGFLSRRRGRYLPFWAVASPEASVSVAGVSGTNTLTLGDFDFGNYYTGDAARKDIAFLVGGVIYPHRVTGWAPVAGGYRATLETNLAVNVPVGTLVAFLRFCRMSADSFDLDTYGGCIGGEAALEFTEVPSEVPV